MRTKKFLYNVVFTGFYQIVLMIAGFIIPRIMLINYGSEINGLVSSIKQFIVYFNLVEAGLSGAAIYALYNPLAEKDYMNVNAILSAAKKFYKQSGYIFIFLAICLSLIYPIYVSVESLNPVSVGLLVLILSFNGVLEFLTLAKYRVLLTADQKTYIISLASVIQVIINTFIIIMLGSMQINIVILTSVALLSIFSRSIILMVYVKKKYSYINYDVIPNDKALSKRWDALYLQILGVIHKGSPVVILTLVSKNLKLVSVYTIFNMIIGAINGILSIFISGLSASFGDVIARGETYVLQKAFKEFEFIYYFLITIVYSVTFIVIMPFIRVYTAGITDINYDIPLIGFLFVLNGLLYNIKTPQGMLVISAGMFKETKMQTTIQGVIAVVIGIVLAPGFGIIGVLVGSILSNIYRDIDLIIFVAKNITKLTIISTVFRVIRIFISIFIICVPFLFIKNNPYGYFDWVMKTIIVGVFSIVITLILSLVFERNTMKDVRIRFWGMVKR